MDTLTSPNYFEMFGLKPHFRIDLNQLELSFRRLQAEVHPDRHASGSESQKRQALQVSTQVNDGYRALRHAASRAQCLIRLAGQADLEAPVPGSFLMAQMEWQESIEEARKTANIPALEALAKRLKHKIVIHENDLAHALDERGDFVLAAQRVNELRFYERLRADIEDTLDHLDG